MEIQVYIKHVYGNPLCYPFCDTAKKFAELVGRKSFTKHDLETIKSLGYTITRVIGE